MANKKQNELDAARVIEKKVFQKDQLTKYLQIIYGLSDKRNAECFCQTINKFANKDDSFMKDSFLRWMRPPRDRRGIGGMPNNCDKVLNICTKYLKDLRETAFRKKGGYSFNKKVLSRIKTTGFVGETHERDLDELINCANKANNANDDVSLRRVSDILLDLLQHNSGLEGNPEDESYEGCITFPTFETKVEDGISGYVERTPCDDSYEIEKDLLAPLSHDEGKKYYYDSGGQRTPLRQALEEFEEKKVFFVHGGKQDLMVSGSGKTTALRALEAEYRETKNVNFLSLHDYYGVSILNNQPFDALTDAQKIWKAFNSIASNTEKETLILIDGLDEIGRDGASMFLNHIQKFREYQGEARFVVTCKVPLEGLYYYFDIQDQIEGFFADQDMVDLQVEELTSEQKDNFFKSKDKIVGKEKMEAIKTPFNAVIYNDVQNAIKDNEMLITMQRFIETNQLNEAKWNYQELFYYNLVVQIAKWYKFKEITEIEKEANALYLMHTLPAVAFYQSVVGDIFEKKYVSGYPVGPMSCEVDSIIDNTVNMIENSIFTYPSYQEEQNQELLRKVNDRDYLKREKFMESKAACFLMDKTEEGLRYIHKFFSSSIKTEFMKMHLANVFFSAYHGKLEDVGDDLQKASRYLPLRYLGRDLLTDVVVYCDFLFSKTGNSGKTREILKTENHATLNGANGFTKYVLGLLATELCNAINNAESCKAEQRIDNNYWIELAREGYSIMTMPEECPEIAKAERVEYVVSVLGDLSRRARSKCGEMEKAIEYADEAIGFFTDGIEAPPYQSLRYGFLIKANIFRDLVQICMNGKTDFDSTCLEKHFADDVNHAKHIYESLEMYADKRSETRGASEAAFNYSIDYEGNKDIFDAVYEIVKKSKAHLDLINEEAAISSEDKAIVKLSFLCKTYAAFATLSEEANGAAMNMLAVFAMNNQEVCLYKFIKNKYGDRVREEYTNGEKHVRYDDRFMVAAKILWKIAHIKRGNQNYSYRLLGYLMLYTDICLDEEGTLSHKENLYEWNQKTKEFLDRATRIAATNNKAGSSIARIQFLNSCGNDDSKEELEYLYRVEWERCNCEEKFGEGGNVDFWLFQLISEYDTAFSIECIENVIKDGWSEKIEQFKAWSDDQLQEYGCSYKNSSVYVMEYQIKYCISAFCRRRPKGTNKNRFNSRDIVRILTGADEQ